jgi:hypothetical protein
MISKSLAGLGLAVALSGCASLNRIDNDVSSFSRWPAGRAPGTYAFERLPSQQARPQQSQLLEDAARQAIEQKGFTPVPEGRSADVSIQVGARIVETDRSPFDDPFWYHGFGTWHRPFAYGRFGRPFWGPGWRGGYWGPHYHSMPYYEREVAVLIRDKRTGEPLYEARAESQGATAGLANILPAMFVAAMQSFPTGSPTNPHRVSVDATPRP